MSSPLLGYIDRDGPLHTLSGVSKLVLSLGVVLGAMIGFDVRYLAAVSAGSILLWAVSRVRLRDLAVVLWLIAIFMVLNNIGIFLFAPGYGTDLFGTRHLLLEGPWRWDVTAEQLFYQLAVTLKYVAVLPAVLLFVATTRPPEFASSLARVGVPYRIAYAVSLALRYIPDVQREFRTISQAQQAARDGHLACGAPAHQAPEPDLRADAAPARHLRPYRVGIRRHGAAGLRPGEGTHLVRPDTRPCRRRVRDRRQHRARGDADRSAGGQRRTVLEPVPLSGRRCRLLTHGALPRHAARLAHGALPTASCPPGARPGSGVRRAPTLRRGSGPTALTRSGLRRVDLDVLVRHRSGIERSTSQRSSHSLDIPSRFGMNIEICGTNTISSRPITSGT